MSQKERAAPQNGTTPTTPSPGHATTKAPKVPTLLELAAAHLLESGMKGTSQLTFFPLYHDFNYRNRIDELRNDHDVIIHSMPFDHRNRAGRIARFERYWLADREEARKVAELVNLKRRQRNALPMEPELIACYLAGFPALPGELPPAA
ncbi:hypothetical protein [Aeromonas sp. QDB02]|uniref:hypothetical protein n=1 Tax=Aeromonas sp. QDB02 TaxID=2990476 RepID=UPI0022E433EF|nr:hypothetical protein [Aeromonas sp. QDB02]